MQLNESLIAIIEILKTGESDSYVDAATFLFKQMQEDKDNDTYDMKKYWDSAISIHILLRNKYKADFNGPLLSWYRRYIGLYGGLK